MSLLKYKGVVYASTLPKGIVTIPAPKLDTKKIYKLSRSFKVKKWTTGTDEDKFTSRVNRLGGDGKLLNTWISGWARASDSNDSAHMRGALVPLISEMTGEKAKSLYKADRDSLTFSRLRKPAEYSSQDIKRYLEEAFKAHDKGFAKSKKLSPALKFLAGISQSMHKPMITIYRGVHSPQSDTIREQIKNGAKEITINTGVVSSFTESHRQAAKFAKGSPTGGKELGVVIKLTLPKQTILLSYRALPHLRVDVHGKQEISILTKGFITIPVADLELLSEPRPSYKWMQLME